MKKVTKEEYDRLFDHAEVVAREAWAKLADHDATAALIVIGSLLASVEEALGWPRDRVLDEICEVADTCEPAVATQ